MKRIRMFEDHISVALKLLESGEGFSRIDFLEELIDTAMYHLKKLHEV